jgi:hypothetical protein
VPRGIKGFFDVQEHRNRRHFIVEIKCYVVRQPHTLQCRAVTFTETELACVEQAAIINMFLKKLQDHFLE